MSGTTKAIVTALLTLPVAIGVEEITGKDGIGFWICALMVTLSLIFFRDA